MLNNVLELKTRALDENIPIMQDKTLDYICDLIEQKNIKTILEIGTGVGYSTIVMALSKKDLKIVSIERDENRYLEALKNIKEFKLEDQITLIFNDAFNVNLDSKYDLIVLDGAKGQNERFFQKFKDNLERTGFIITDNMYFHGYVEHPEKAETKDLRSLIEKIKNYHTFLKNNEEFETKILKVGDGIAVSRYKE